MWVSFCKDVSFTNTLNVLTLPQFRITTLMLSVGQWVLLGLYLSLVLHWSRCRCCYNHSMGKSLSCSIEYHFKLITGVTFS